MRHASGISGGIKKELTGCKTGIAKHSAVGGQTSESSGFQRERSRDPLNNDKGRDRNREKV